MGKIFSIDSPVMSFLSKTADLMLLNILWILCCIPVITIGASTAAMYSVLIRLARDTGDGIVKPFFRAFKKDFWKSTALFLTFVVIGLIVVANTILSQKLGTVIGTLVFIPLVLFLTASGYVFPLFAQFDNTILDTLKNAVIMSLAHFSKSIVVFLLNALPLIIILVAEPLFWQTLIIWFLIGVALVAFLVTKILIGVFDKYTESEQTDEELANKEITQ